MILPVYLYGTPVLREETEDIDKDYPELRQLVDDMYETMYHSDGVGLAAPQIGRSISVIVIDGNPVADHFPECRDMKLTLINPEMEVIEDMAPVTREEGCLSLPGLSEPVKRVEHVRVKWLDENLEEHEREFSGFISRIIQHENDHLYGKVYMDHVSPIRRQLAKGKLSAIAKGNVDCEYRVKRSKRR